MTLAPQSPMTLVTFSLGRQRLAIPTEILREILDPLPLTRVPGAQGFVPGVVNVRGSVVPLADLRHALGITGCDGDDRSRIMVLELEIEGEPILVAIRADAVHEVTTIPRSKIEAVPAASTAWPAEYTLGLYKAAEGFVLLPHLTHIFASHCAAGLPARALVA